MFENISNEEIVEKIKQGDENALEELFLRFKPLINRLARSFFLFGGEIDDIKQEAMIGLYKACLSYKQDYSFQSFAQLCMKRRIISAIKSANRNKNKALNESISIENNFEDGEVQLFLPDFILSPEEQFEEDESFFELKNKIKAVLSALELNILNEFLRGYSYEKIAQELSISKKSVDNALSRIKTKIKQLLK